MAHKTFFHAGDIGDVLYGLIVMQRMGGGALWLGPTHDLGARFKPRVGITGNAYMALAGFVATQPYVERLDWSAYPPFVMNDLNTFRYFWRGDFAHVFGSRPGRVNLQHMHLTAFNISVGDEAEPWLVAGKDRRAAVIISRSARYHNWTFPWPAVVAKYKRIAGFVGLPQDYADFVREFPEACEVKYIPTPTYLELANVINACDLFVGNQSSPYAVAEGLKVTTIQETRNDVEHDRGADCVFNRPNAQFVRDGHVTLPDL